MTEKNVKRDLLMEEKITKLCSARGNFDQKLKDVKVTIIDDDRYLVELAMDVFGRRSFVKIAEGRYWHVDQGGLSLSQKDMNTIHSIQDTLKKKLEHPKGNLSEELREKGNLMKDLLIRGDFSFGSDGDQFAVEIKARGWLASAILSAVAACSDDKDRYRRWSIVIYDSYLSKVDSTPLGKILEKRKIDDIHHLLVYWQLTKEEINFIESTLHGRLVEIE